MFIFYLDKTFRGGIIKNMKKHKHYQGFTIIEVVLVLAIAGLVFLMVFLALPALQRAQRDTQRKNDMARLKAAYQQYRANNKGRRLGSVYNGEYMAKLPNWEKFLNEYLRKDGDIFRDPSGKDYFLQAGLWNFVRGDEPGTGVITFNDRMACDYESPRTEERNKSGIGEIIRIRLETGGVYCLDLIE